MKTKIFYLLLCASMLLSCSHRKTDDIIPVSLTLNVEKAGTLSSLIGNRISEITDLTLTGNLNREDIIVILTMTDRKFENNVTNSGGKLSVIDLSGTNIVGYNKNSGIYLLLT